MSALLYGRDVSEDVLRLNRPVEAPVPESVPEPTGAVAERELQHSVEEWLVARRYYRLTAENAKRIRNGEEIASGWFGHWHGKVAGLPLMSDLLILDASGRRSLLLELKVGERLRWQPGQKEMVALDVWKVAFDLEQAKRCIEEWEDKP